jgi:hypothetical protein
MSRAERYDMYGVDYHWNWWVSRTDYRQWIGRILSEFPREGDGVVASQLDARGFEVYGVDVLKGPLKIATAKVPAATFSDQIPDQIFDYVLINNALPEMNDQPALFEAVSKCREYAVITMTEYAFSSYDLQRMFTRCGVELSFEEDDTQVYIVEPQR